MCEGERETRQLTGYWLQETLESSLFVEETDFWEQKLLSEAAHYILAVYVRDLRRPSADCRGSWIWARPHAISIHRCSSGRDSRRPSDDCRGHDWMIGRFQGGNCGIQLPKKGVQVICCLFGSLSEEAICCFLGPDAPQQRYRPATGGLCYWCVCVCGPT